MEFTDTDTERLVSRATGGDEEAVGQLLTYYRPRLRRMVAVRLDPRVRGRVDVSDVVQEACLEASQRIGEYSNDTSVPFFVWLRFLTTQQLASVHRRHLGTQLRQVTREVPLWARQAAPVSSDYMAKQLAASHSTPSAIAQREELRVRIQETLDRMDAPDREVLAMRHYEQLSNSEIAHVLGINASTASTKYVRALRRFRKELGDIVSLFASSQSAESWP